MLSKKNKIGYYTPMKIIICDDNAAFAGNLKNLISDYCAKKDLPLDCSLYYSSMSFLSADLSSVQAVFLDIDMPKINGLEVAKQLRRRRPDLIIVFVTAYIEYAPAGYRVDAFRYLLKTQVNEELFPILDDIQQKLFAHQETILLRQGDYDIPVALKDILYFEGTPRREVLVHLLNAAGPLHSSGKLSDFVDSLREKGFLRLQKSYLANMEHIIRIRSYKVTLRNYEVLNASEKNYSNICEEYLQWKGMQR